MLHGIAGALLLLFNLAKRLYAGAEVENPLEATG
jgi:hypothetical protein